MLLHMALHYVNSLFPYFIDIWLLCVFDYLTGLKYRKVNLTMQQWSLLGNANPEGIFQTRVYGFDCQSSRRVPGGRPVVTVV